MWKTCRQAGVKNVKMRKCVCIQECKDKLRTREITKECAATGSFATALETLCLLKRIPSLGS